MTRASQWTLAALATCLFACGALEESPDSDLSRADESCVQQHNLWLTLEYAPLTCEDGPDCVGRVPLDTMPACDGRAAFSSWSLAWFKHVQLPWTLRRGTAMEEFALADSPQFQDRDRFVEQTQPSESEKDAHDALLTVLDLETVSYSSWFDRYSSLLSDLAFPLYSQATVASSLHGRNTCGDPFAFEQVDFACNHEPSLFLNPSEEAILDLVRDFRPTTSIDGDLGQWIEFYDDYLHANELSTRDFVFPTRSGRGLAGYELAFFEHLQTVQPLQAGPIDSAAWIGLHTVMLSTVDFSESDHVLQLDLFRATKPTVLTGTSAYESWIGADTLGLGFLDVHSDLRKLERLLVLKPCAHTDDQVAEMTQTFSTFSDEHSEIDTTPALPVRCTADEIAELER